MANLNDYDERADPFMQLPLSQRLGLVLCDRSHRNPNAGICCQPLLCNDNLVFGIRAWLDGQGWDANTAGIGATLRRPTYPIVGGFHGYKAAVQSGTCWKGEAGRERKQLLRFLIQFYRSKGN